MKDFNPVPDHVDFDAKRLFENAGALQDGSIIYAKPNGGGPTKDIPHNHNHLFIVIKGEAKVIVEGKESIIPENECATIPGKVSHSIWNNSSENDLIMVSLSVLQD